MRRGREKDLEKYVNVRIAQLKQDMEKAHDDYDKQWSNRIIQELCWVKNQQHNCSSLARSELRRKRNYI